MLLEQTQYPLAVEQLHILDLFYAQVIKGKIPLTVLNYVKNNLDAVQVSHLKQIEFYAPKDRVHFDFGNKAKGLIIHLCNFNEIDTLNKYLVQLNQALQLGGYLVGCLASGKGKKLRFTEIETCGWISAHGFDLLEIFENPDRIYFIAKKTKTQQEPIKTSCGNFICLKRVGKYGREIKVYKLRTMYPGSQYLQGYIYDHFGLQTGGKLKNDPRVTPLGRVLRRYFLDEIPMLINWLKGELKFFGVRPITRHYLSLYPEDYQRYRTRFRPGLIPPYYADLPKTLDEIILSEQRYLQAYEKQPFLTDLRYLRKVFYNIIIKGIRSE